MLRRGHGLDIALSVRPRQFHGFRAGCLRAYSSAADSVRDVAVLGGGITGLATAYYITKEFPNAKVTIYEASDRIGGWLSSARVPVKDGTVLFEAGPRTLRPDRNGALSARLMQEIDLAKDAIFAQSWSAAARNRYIYWPDRLIRMPHPSFSIWSNLYSLWTEPAFAGALPSVVRDLSADPRDKDVSDESVGSFFSRRFSKSMVDRILSGVLHGIYAGDVWQLSAKSLFPVQWRDEIQDEGILRGLFRSSRIGHEVTKHEVGFLQAMKEFEWDPLLRDTLRTTVAFTFRDGLAMLSNKLARHLMRTGKVEFKMTTPVESVKLSAEHNHILVKARQSPKPRRHDLAISTLAPEQLNQLHENTNSSLVPKIRSVTVMTVNLYYRSPDLHPAGFGYLIPQATPFENNPERALGVVFDTAYSPSSADANAENWQAQNADLLRDQMKQAREEGRVFSVNDFAWYNLPDMPNIQDNVAKRGTKVTVMLGGHYWDGWPAYPDEQEGLALARSLLERQLGIKEEPEAWQVNLQKDCIPQYTVGHEERLRAADGKLRWEYKGRLRVAGSWICGVGVNDCLRSAWEVVRGISEGRDGTGLEHVGTTEYVRLMPKTKGQ